MSLLTEIKSFIKSEVLGIEETNTKTSSEQKKSDNVIIECKTEAPEDKFIKNTSEESSTDKNNISQKALEETISNIPTKTIDLKQMLKDGLIEKITGLTKDNFEKLSNKQKLLAFRSIQAAIKKYETLQARGLVDKSANVEEIIVSYSTNIYQAVSSGVFKDEKEYENASDDINKSIEKNFDKKSKTERRAEFKRRKAEFKRVFNEQLEEIKKLPDDQRRVELRKLMLRRLFLSRKHFLEIAAERKSEVAADAMHLLEAEDLEYGAKTLLQTRSCNKERTLTADYADYNFTKELIQTNSEYGEKVNSEVLKGYTETFMEYKSADAAYEYQSSYTLDRTIYENALRKKQNGETLSAEEEALLSYMETDYYTATAQGIGQGIINNINMTSEQKAQFLSAWENDAKQFNDYNQVTSTVKKILEENTEFKEIKEHIENIKSKEKEEILEKSKTNCPEIGEKKFFRTYQYNNTDKQNSGNAYSEKPIEYNTTHTEESTLNTKKEKAIFSLSTNPIEIIQNIRKEGVEKALQEYGTSAISLILDSSGLKHLRPRLTTIIRSYDLKTLTDITQSCSDSSFVYICSIVNKDYVEKLKENRDNTKGLCYAAEKQVKNLEGENATV